MLKILLRHTRRGSFYLARILLLLVLVSGVSGAVFLRYWLLPQIERYHGDIEAAASATLGRPLTIARIEASWEGLRPSLLLSEVSIRDEQNNVALQLPAMRNTVAWSSLLFGELRFYSLQLDNPQLLIRRDQAGILYVAGVQSDARTSIVSDATSADWLLHQTRIVIRNGRLVWQDEMRGAPAITFEQVDLTLDNSSEHHRFDLHAAPPSALATTVEVKGDLYGTDFATLADWHGELSGDIAGLDVAAWRPWLDLPAAGQQGSGDLQLTLRVAQGAVTKVVASVDLHEVKARLGADLPELAVRRMKGQLGWRQLDGGFEISANDFSLRLHDGFNLPTTNFLLNWNGRSGYRSASGEVRADNLDLAGIAVVLDYLPLEPALKNRVAEMGLQGRVRNLHASWQGDMDKLLRYRLQAQFEKVAMRQVRDLPGFSGLSGTVDGSDSDGELSLNSNDLKFQIPDFLAEPLQFDRVTGRLTWQRNPQRSWDLKLNDLRVANADLSGTVFGGYQLNGGAGVADLTVNLARASVRHVARYIPQHSFGAATYHWLQTGLQGGLADSFQLRVRGNLRDFPFADGKTGLFRLTAKAKGVAIEFAPAWPRIEQAQAELLIQGGLLEVKAATAHTAGASLQHVRVALPDMLADRLLMEVDGEAADETQRALDYIRNSPVRTYLNGYTDAFQARGKGLLRLHLDILLDQSSPTQVRGSYRLDGNELDLGAHVPLMKNARGEIAFGNDSLQAREVTAQILGGPAQLSLRNDGGNLLVDADGTMDAGSLHANYGYALLSRLQGKTDWQARISVRDKLATVQVSSTLLGLTSSLPQPFNKAAEQKVPLYFEMHDISATQDTLQLRYGKTLDATLVRNAPAGGGWEIRRGSILLGDVKKTSAAPGISIIGHLPRFDLQGWNGWSDLPQREGVLPNIARIDVTLDQVAGFGNRWRDLNIRGSGRNGLVSTRLTSPEINGDLIWQPQYQGKLLVRLKQLKLGEGRADEASSATSATVQVPGPVSIPVIDMRVDHLAWKGRELGRLELMLEGEEGDVVLKSLHLTNPDAMLEAGGRWRTAAEETQIDLKVEFADAGKLLARYGYPGSVAGAGGVLEGSLSWHGAPETFSYPGLFGSVRVKVGKGRFLKVDPGAAKLLGVLSLQSLPRRISLDFTDVFSPGFQFSAITGMALIEHGMLKTDDFTMAGAAAKVTMRGEVDLQRETQNLKVTIFPALGDNVSLLSFAAGPVVGAGVLLANKLLSDPLDKLVSFDYNVSGSWADPVVERIVPGKPSPDE